MCLLSDMVFKSVALVIWIVFHNGISFMCMVLSSVRDHNFHVPCYFHRFKLERPANSHDIRKMVRIEDTLRFTGSQRGDVTRYLDGTTKDASQMQNAAEVVATAVLLDTLSR